MPTFKKINFPIVFNLLGIFLLLNSIFMLLCVPVSLYYGEQSYQGILLAGIVCALVGGGTYLLTKNASKNVGKREGYLVVSLGWLTMALFGSFPYLFSISQLPAAAQEINQIGITNAFFETMSGYTTTGSSILQDIEIMPKGLLFWRSLTHWIGGMGIIVLTIAILPLLGIGGMQLFVAEAPGISPDKLHPRITDTAKRLWIIYVIFTVIQTVFLRIAGMNWYDAVNHALSTLSTGGFSTKNASIAHWNDTPLVQYIIILFMFLAGTNFVLNYYLFKLKPKKLTQNQEFKMYVGIVLGTTAICSVLAYFFSGNGYTIESSIRHLLFSVLAVITTTGFVTEDFTNITPFVTVVFFALMFIGGSAGSTSGGVKIVRHLILIKNSYSEFKRLIHPNAIIPVRYNQKSVPRNIVYNVLAFFFIYLMMFIVGSLVMAFLDSSHMVSPHEFMSTIGVTASSLGNVGPAFGKYSPVDNYAGMNDAAKWFCSFLMLIGRLELFTILVLFTPFFWKK